MMLIKKIFLLTSLFFLFHSINFSQKNQEIRAVWIATNHRLDWPPPTFDIEVQKKSLIEIFDSIKSKNLNTIYFQVRSNGTVLFNSSFEPCSFYIDGKGNLPYDPLQFAIQEAHKRGIEIHAWLNVVQVFAGGELDILNNPDHIVKRKPDWIIEYQENEMKSYWLNPAIPEVREYISDLIKELVKNYNVDGIHLDYIRYPGRNFNDDSLFNIYGKGLSKDNWRRKNITDLIELINKKIKSVKPYVKLGATPIGIYKNHSGMSGWEGYNDVYQDAREWLKRGLLDYIVPQVYWSIENNFEVITREWVNNSFGKNVIIGIGAFKDDIKSKIEKMIEYTRTIGAQGFAIFRYSSIKDYKFQNFLDNKTSTVNRKEQDENEIFEPVNFSLMNSNFLKPVLIKKSKDNYDVIIFSETEDEVMLKGSHDTDEEIIITTKIKSGKNLIELKSDLSRYKEILLIFLSSNKMMKLKM